MTWNLLALAGLMMVTGICVVASALRRAAVEDGMPAETPSPDVSLDRGWHEQPVQIFVMQVQAARCWQPPFCRR